MPKQILAVAPVNLRIAGRIYSIEAGKSLAVSDDESQMIMSGSSSSKFKLIGDFMSETPISIHSAGLPTYAPPKTAAPNLAAHKDWATPFVPGTVPDPIDDVYKFNAEANKDFYQAVLELPGDPISADGPLPEASISQLPERTPITPDTHWSKVKAHLSVIAKQEPINYGEVEEIRQMFSKSPSIRVECDRILANRP
jgi:hypothetical protein